MESNEIAESIWRSGFIVDKNKVRQEAKNRIRKLIATDLASSLAQKDPNFDREEFMRLCGVQWI
jgi:hypothetical protein